MNATSDPLGATSAQRATPRKVSRKRTSRSGATLGMGGAVFISLIPAVCLFTIFYLVPLGVLAVTSLADWSGAEFQYIGIQNFRELFADPTFWKAARNTLVYAAIGVFVQVPLGVLIGIVLAQHIPGWRLLRTVLFLPFLVSGAALALVFTSFYNPRYGLLNGVLGSLGFDSTRNWLFETDTALLSVAATFAFIVGFSVVVVTAEVAAIPSELYEAAELDGAGVARKHLYVTLPLLRNAVGTLVLLALLGYLGLFDLVFILTAGGPNDSTVTLVLYGYRAYVSSQWGYANAVGVVVVAIGLLLIVTVRRVFRIGEPA